ncbi:DUF4189 domain-containing protein [Roseococcus sp. YIM B11640]|uniref:DUF4189 domain-containing protein n=1 Tax=Roseococcus sp. YIM B11640 TaxID=3133973 RepID=UPI003C7D2A1E
MDRLFGLLTAMLFVGLLAIPVGTRAPSGCGNACAAGARNLSSSISALEPAAAMQPPRYGAFYLARMPSMRYGVSVGQRDPRAAQDAAEAQCRSAPRGCAPVAEFTDACIAVAEGIKRIALVVTSDPRTYELRAIAHGTASNPADAQAAALRECAAREGGRLTCRIAHQVCGPR